MGDWVRADSGAGCKRELIDAFGRGWSYGAWSTTTRIDGNAAVLAPRSSMERVLGDLRDPPLEQTSRELTTAIAGVWVKASGHA